MEKIIKGVTHPVPTEFATRIYNGKNVFIGKMFLGKVKKGDKFVLYESHGAKAYTGWADIIQIKKMKKSDILTKYDNQLMINSEEFKEYSKNRNIMTIIEFENFEFFNNKVVPKKFIPVGGKYIDYNELNMIKENKD